MVFSAGPFRIRAQKSGGCRLLFHGLFEGSAFFGPAPGKSAISGHAFHGLFGLSRPEAPAK